MFPCETTRQAMNPVTGALMGAGTAALIGQIVPGTGSPTNGIVRAGDGISKYNYTWPTLAVAPRVRRRLRRHRPPDVRRQGRRRIVLRSAGRRFDLLPVAESADLDEPDRPQRPAADPGHGRGRGSSGVPTLINYRYDNPNLPSSLQWNTGVQMALPWSSSLDVAYVGQHSFHVLNMFQSLTAVNINAIDLGAAFLPQNQDPTRSAAVPRSPVPAPTCRNCSGRSAATRNIDQQWQEFERTFHSMQFSANRRFRNGVSFGGNYTLSLSDNGTTGVPLRLQHDADGSFFIREDQAIFNEMMKNQGLQRHIVKANFIWDLPDWRTTGARRIVAAIVNDWQLSGHLHRRLRRQIRHHLHLPEQRREREPDRLA